MLGFSEVVTVTNFKGKVKPGTVKASVSAVVCGVCQDTLVELLKF